MWVSYGLPTFLWCVFVVFIGHFSRSHGAFLRCYRNSIEDYEVSKLENGHVLLNTTCYNYSHRNLFYAFGFMGESDGIPTRSVIEAFLKVPGLNLFLLDWEKEASSIEKLGTLGQQLSYIFNALPQTIVVGKRLGNTLLKMSKDCLDLNKTELMGHSLGAHVMGNAGRVARDEGKPVDLITGLDPAGPNFDSLFPRYPALDFTCGKYVRSLHTDPGGYGMNSSIATLDIYANFKHFINGTPNDQVQPGCPKGVFRMFSEKDLCSHNRSWRYRITALFNKGSILASNGTDYFTWEAANCDNQHVIDIDEVDRSARGNYYFTTNAEETFGRYKEGLSP